jgi:L-phenylalanine/L-methionine N-acetyltransferase
MTILVRAAEPSDYEAVRETMAQPRALAMTLQLPLPSFEMWKKRIVDVPATDHMLVAEINRKVVGNLGLQAASKAQRRRHVASLGMAVHDDYQRRGVGSAMMKAALDLADNWLQYTRIELQVYTDNEGGIALYKKFGFETEGTLKKYAFRNGVMVDAYAMARLKE